MNRVGLYSIGVRGLEVPDLLAWAHRHGLGFVHLRGGPRGFDLARRETAEVERWRRAAAERVPITGVTADLDLADLHHPDPAHRSWALRELENLARAARAVGANWVRLLARTPLSTPLTAPVDAGMPLLVELHHPAWWEAAPHRFLLDLLDEDPGVAVLADTAQLAHAQSVIGPGVEQRWEQVAARAQVLHLSDNGSGLDPGHARIARSLARRIHAGQQVEVAVEWTGPDRTRAVCLRRYRALRRWWHHILEQERPRP